MSAADVRIRADEVRHERTDARKTRWTASLRFVTASGITFVNKLHSIKSPIVLQSRHVYNRGRKYARKCARSGRYYIQVAYDMTSEEKQI